MLQAQARGAAEDRRRANSPTRLDPRTVRLVVKDGEGKHSIEGPKTAGVCDEKPSPTPTEPPPTPAESVPGEQAPSKTPSTGTPEPSATPSEQPSESVPAPSPSSPDLAETGSSSTPIIGGAAVAVLLAGGGILWAVRERRSPQN